MEPAAIWPDDGPKEKHTHLRPSLDMDYRTTSDMTRMPVGFLYRCRCGEWFRAASFGNIYQKWQPVRWYNFTALNKIKEFEDSESDE